MKHRSVLLSALIGFCFAGASAFAGSYTFQPVDTISGDSNHTDLGDLAHTNAYTWGVVSSSAVGGYNALKTELNSGQYTITSATLTISNLYNWDARDTNNQLFIHLLDNPLAGVKVITDDPTDNGINQGVLSDYFGGKISGNLVNGKWVAYGYANTAAGALLSTGATNLWLTQYHDNDGPTTKPTFSFSFSGSQLTTLDTYILNGHTGGSSYSDFGLGFDPDCHFYNDGVKLQVSTSRVPDSGTTLLLLGLGLLALIPARRVTAPSRV